MVRCKNCDLFLNSSNQLKGEVGDNEDDKLIHIMFVYGSPTVTQDKHGSVFKGRHFKAFKDMLDDAKILKYSYHTHLIKCKLPFSEVWDYQNNELKTHHCSMQHFNAEFKDKCDDVKIVVPVGKFAYQMLTNVLYLTDKVYQKRLHIPVFNGKYTVIPMDTINTMIDTNLVDFVKYLRDCYGTINPRVLI